MGIKYIYVSFPDYRHKYTGTGCVVKWSEYKYTVCVTGDLFGDGFITSKDTLAMKKISTSVYESSEAERISADIYGDGRFNAKCAYALRMSVTNGWKMF